MTVRKMTAACWRGSFVSWGSDRVRIRRSGGFRKGSERPVNGGKAPP